MSIPTIKGKKIVGDFKFRYSNVFEDNNIQYKQVTFNIPIDVSDSNIELYANKLKDDFISEFTDE